MDSFNVEFDEIEESETEKQCNLQRPLYENVTHAKGEPMKHKVNIERESQRKINYKLNNKRVKNYTVICRDCFKIKNNMLKNIENKCQCKVDNKIKELFGVEPYVDLEFSWMKPASEWKTLVEKLAKKMNGRQSYKVKYNN